MKRFLPLVAGLILTTSPGISKSDDKDEAGDSEEEGAIEQLDAWTPPTVSYSISNIGRIVEQDGVELKCYTPEEGARVLLPMFADYRALLRMSWLWMAAKAEFEAKISAMESKLELQAGSIAFYQDESENWMKIAKSQAQKIELSSKWAWVPWGLVVAESLVVGFVGVRAAATK